MPIALNILLIALAAIAFRKVLSIDIPIWTVMTVGAVTVFLFGQITLAHALAAIDPNVILYLLGVFLISQAAEESGYLEHLTDRLFFHVNNGSQALLIITFVLGLSSALFMNDTIAIIGAPIILQLCKSHRELTKPLLLALAFAITIGSVLSPIGNPQNLLIAVKSGMISPFLKFIKFLAIPTLINLIITCLFIFVTHRHVINETITKPVPVKISDYRTFILVRLSLIIMIVLIIVKISSGFIKLPFQIDFSYIALIAAAPILLSKKRWALIRQLDWPTLIFFVSTFVLIQSVWDSGFFQLQIRHLHISVTSIFVILALSIVLSQFISNVPLVSLYLPLLIHQNLPETHFLALAVGSTVAGNLSILGAASNVIIFQNAEKRGYKELSFFEFSKFGIPLTILNVSVYAYFLLC